MNDQRSETIVKSNIDFDNRFWCDFFKVINTRDCIRKFDGIKICISDESGGQHNLPHLHALYNGYEVSARIPDVEVFAGEFL